MKIKHRLIVIRTDKAVFLYEDFIGTGRSIL